jgi:NADPH2 dehydrogenase
MVSRIGASRTGIRLSPFGRFNDMRMADPIPQFSHLLSELAKSHPDLAYVHLVDPRVAGMADPRIAGQADNTDVGKEDTLDFARDIWRPTGSALLVAGGFNAEFALDHYDVPGRENEAVVFGRWFISNVGAKPLFSE